MGGELEEEKSVTTQKKMYETQSPILSQICKSFQLTQYKYDN